MTIKHDDQGFLIGHRVENDNVIDLLEAIRKEIKSLREDVGGGALVALPERGTTDKSKEKPSKDTVASPVSSSGPGLSAVVSPRSSESTAQSQTVRDLQARSSDKNTALDARPEKVEVSSTTNNFYSGDTSTSVTSDSSSRSTVSIPAGGSVAPALVALPVTKNVKAATPKSESSNARDSKGRFLPGLSEGRSGKGFSGNDDDDSVSDQILVSAIGDMGEKITGAVGELAFSEESDPSVKAFNEVAKPLQRGLGKIFGGGEDKSGDRWYKRFWRHMREDKKLDKKRHKEQVDILEDIEKKSSGKDGSNGLFLRLFIPMLGFFAAILKALLPLKLLGALKYLPGMPGGKKSPKGGGKTAKGPRVGGASAGALKGAAKKIPVVGALLTLVSTLSSVNSSEKDSSKTRREKDVSTTAAIGGGVGAMAGAYAGGTAGGTAGATIGTMIFPGLGTAVGGVLGSLIGAVGGAFLGESAGDIIGSYMGEIVNDIRNSDIAQSISSTWNKTNDFISHLSGQASQAFSEKWDSVSESFSTAWAATTEALGSAWDATTAKFSAAADFVTESWGSAIKSMQQAWSKVTKLAGEWWSSVSEAADKANDWIKDTTGVDIKGAASSVSNSITDTYNSTKNAVSSAVESAGGWVARQAKKAADATGVTGVVSAVRKSASYAENKDALRVAMAEAGITDPNEMASFMGQMDHESGGFTSLDESFNYKSADRIMAVSKTARNKGPEAVNQAMQQGPEAVAELMYGGRMGNVNEGDGYAFRGRGFTQLTGRDNYTQAGEALGLDLANNPDLASDPAVAAKIATWYWQSRSGLSEAGKAGDVEATTRKINGGLNGLEDRKAKTAMYKKEALSGSLSAPAQKSPAIKPDDTQSSEQAILAQKLSRSPGAVESIGPEKTSVVAGGGPASVTEVARSQVSVSRNEKASVANASAPWMPSPVASVVASSYSPVASNPALTSSPRPPSVSDSPEVRAPMATPDNKSSSGNAAGNNQVSRDLSDRRIAHVVTGAHSQL